MRAVSARPEIYSLDGLAAHFEDFGVTRRKIQRWVNDGLIPPAHGTNPRWKYYDATHIRAIRAVIAVRENNTTFADLIQFLKEEGISVTDYAKARGLTSHA